MKEYRTLNLLFDFQSVCDTDLGLYRLIERDYYDKDIFDNILFDSNDLKFIKTMLICREKFNPLFLFCNKNKLTNDEMDDLYKQFLDQEYDNILDLSPPTALLELASVTNSIKDAADIKIICKSEKEIEWIKKYDNCLDCIIDDFKDFDISKYDTIYIKDIYTLLLLNQKSIINKNIILSKYLFNLETSSGKLELPIVEVSQLYYKTNLFLFIDPYKDIVIPVSEMI